MVNLNKFASKKKCLAFILLLNIVALVLYTIELHFDNKKKDIGFSEENDDLVPNIVHIMLLDQTDIRFYQIVNIYSIYFNQKPSQIYIHCNKCNFKGKYFNELKENNEIWSIISFRRIISDRLNEESHLKFDILSEYGGIFLDRNIYILKSMKTYFLSNKMIISGNFSLGNSVLIASKNSRFLKKFKEFYSKNTNEKTINAEKLISLNQDLIKRTDLIGTVNLFVELFEKNNE